MKIRFLGDADLNRAILNGLVRREPSIDFMPANELGLTGLNDLKVLEIAALSGRVVVSHDVGTMPKHFRAYRELGKSSAGVCPISQRFEVGKAIEELMII